MDPSDICNQIDSVRHHEQLFGGLNCCTLCTYRLQQIENYGSSNVITSKKLCPSIIAYEYLTPDERLVYREIAVNSCCLWKKPLLKRQVFFCNEFDLATLLEKLKNGDNIQTFKPSVVEKLENLLKTFQKIGNIESSSIKCIRVIEKKTNLYIDMSNECFQFFKTLIDCEPFSRRWEENLNEPDEKQQFLQQVVNLVNDKPYVDTSALEEEIGRLTENIIKDIEHLNSLKRQYKPLNEGNKWNKKIEDELQKINDLPTLAVKRMSVKKRSIVKYFDILTKIIDHDQKQIDFMKIVREIITMGQDFLFWMSDVKFFMPYIRANCPEKCLLDDFYDAQRVLNKIINVKIDDTLDHYIIFFAFYTSVLWNIGWNVENLKYDESYVNNTFGDQFDEFNKNFKYHQNTIVYEMGNVARFGDLYNFEMVDPPVCDIKPKHFEKIAKLKFIPLHLDHNYILLSESDSESDSEYGACSKKM